ncbi:phenylalanine N-monooxygenase CYP79D16-like [Euphorbia lathyris]|uniref:phenylalanine N-monooxygenase CYP79D16-like n=1 Tax=Euphorbia lathyris TaxID=212925 RepID=UPI003314156F
MENIITLLLISLSNPKPFLFFILFMSMLFLTFLKFLNLSSTQLPLPPGPKPWPIIGCIPTMLKSKPAVFRWIHNLMKELNTEIVCIRLGDVHTIVVTCPNLSCEFLKAQDSVFASRPISMSTRITSNGYLTTVLVPFGEQWQKMKRIVVSQMLSPAKHKFFYAKRLEEANHLVRYVCNLCRKPENHGLVNIRYVSQHYAGNLTRNIVLSRRSFGNNYEEGPSFEDEEHVGAILSILANTYSFCVSDYFPCLVPFDFGNHDKLIKEANTIMNKYQDPIIQERFQNWSSSGNYKEVEDLLDMFITLKDANGNHLLSKQEIQAQIIEIMVAIVDNPSNVVEWAVAEMPNQPKIMEKAVEELDKVVGKERLVEESDLSELNYIKACAREAFCLHPIVPFNLPHVSMADTTVGNYFIPKGSHVLLSRVGLGRNLKVWDEPEMFKPERHLNGCDQVTLTRSNLRFISFSTGKRGCPGAAMGTSITLMLFARLLQGFSWKIPSNQQNIDLSESFHSLALAKPLVASAIPRLPHHLYLT